MKKQIVIGVCIAVGTLILLLCSLCFFFIWRNTSNAKQSAAAFAACLQEGDFEMLQLAYYLSEQPGTEAFVSEDGEEAVTFVTRQYLAEKYGAALMTSEEEEIPFAQKILRIVMAHSQVRCQVGMTLSSTAGCQLLLSGPDFEAWAGQLSDVEKAELRWNQDRLLERVQNELEAGTIGERSIRLQIPMEKTGGGWRFAVTEEMENQFFGGLPNIFSF